MQATDIRNRNKNKHTHTHSLTLQADVIAGKKLDSHFSYCIHATVAWRIKRIQSLKKMKLKNQRNVCCTTIDAKPNVKSFDIQHFNFITIYCSPSALNALVSIKTFIFRYVFIRSDVTLMAFGLYMCVRALYGTVHCACHYKVYVSALLTINRKAYDLNIQNFA